MIQMPSEVSAWQPYPRNAAARVNIPMLTFKRGRDGLTKEDRAADVLVVPDGGLQPSSGTTPLFVVVRTCGLRPLLHSGRQRRAHSMGMRDLPVRNLKVCSNPC